MSKLSHPKTMKALFLEKPGGPLIVRELSVPYPGPSEVLVKIAAAPVNPSDLARLKKAHIENDLSTFIPGLEGSGTVVAAGRGILSHLWLGKRVACSSHYSTSGTWAEYMVTTAGSCFPLSSKVDNEQGSMSLVNPLTALAFMEIVKQKRHKALINNAAASALGRMIELLGNGNGIPVINIVRNQKQVEMLKEQGSLYILDSSQPSFIDNLIILSGELKATILFDSVCNRQLQEMIDALPHDSSVVIYGNLSGEEEIMINPRTLIDKNIVVSGFFLGNHARKNGLFKNMMNLRKVSQMMSSDLQIKIRGKYPLENAQDAINEYLADMSAGKILLIP